MKNMKKFFIASMLTALFVSCPGFGGEEITSNDIKTAVLEALIAVDNDLTQKFGDAMYQKDYKLDPAGSSIMNVKYSSSCGLTVKERTAYEANLAGYELSPVQLLVDEKGTSADCSIIISGVLKGEISVSRWNSNQNNTAFYESSFENGADPCGKYELHFDYTVTENGNQTTKSFDYTYYVLMETNYYNGTYVQYRFDNAFSPANSSVLYDRVFQYNYLINR